MITIKNALARRFIIEELVNVSSMEEWGELMDAGTPPKLLDILRHMTLRELLAVAQSNDVSIAVEINYDALLFAIQRQRAIRTDVECKEYFVANGANVPMLTTMFKLPFQTAKELIKTFNLGKRSPGRPSLPSHSAREAILKAWDSLASEEKDLKKRYILLHQRFGEFALGCLWQIVSGSVSDERDRANR